MTKPPTPRRTRPSTSSDGRAGPVPVKARAPGVVEETFGDDDGVEPPAADAGAGDAVVPADGAAPGVGGLATGVVLGAVVVGVEGATVTTKKPATLLPVT
jgi:hypothetical protein